MRIVEVVRECPESGTHSPSFEPEAGLCSEAPKRLCREALQGDSLVLGARGTPTGVHGASRPPPGGKYILFKFVYALQDVLEVRKQQK